MLVLFFCDLVGLTEVFGRMSTGISGPKLPLWAPFSFLNCCKCISSMSRFKFQHPYTGSCKRRLCSHDLMTVHWMRQDQGQYFTTMLIAFIAFTTRFVASLSQSPEKKWHLENPGKLLEIKKMKTWAREARRGSYESLFLLSSGHASLNKKGN